MILRFILMVYLSLFLSACGGEKPNNVVLEDEVVENEMIEDEMLDRIDDECGEDLECGEALKAAEEKEKDDARKNNSSNLEDTGHTTNQENK